MSGIIDNRVPEPKPRITVQAGTRDSVVNFTARIGIGQNNLISNTSYSFNPITRLPQLLEWAYRSSWIVGAAVDCVADDMVRAGVEFSDETDPDDIEQLHTAMQDIGMWQSLNEALKWGRLYGGALMVMLIDGHDMATPLQTDRIEQDSLKGFLVLDRWMIQPTYNKLVTDFGPDYGLPEWYEVVATAPFLPRMRIHYTRCVRCEGTPLPFRQRLAENGWSMSVLERLYDRLVAFDSGTMGTAQLLYRAYLRTYKVEGYRGIVTTGGQVMEGFMRGMELIRNLQSNEGLTVIDSKDEFETHQYSFAGLSDTLNVLAQQISGALGIPLTRLFGQSPAGMNATGESDMRNYYDMIKSSQEARLRRPLTKLFEVLWQSVLGSEPPDEWGFEFNPLRQLDDLEKAEIAQRDVDTINVAFSGGMLDITTALKELKQSSRVTGRFTNITDEMVKDAEQQPPPWDQQAQEEQQQQEQEHQLKLAKASGAPPPFGAKPGGPPGAGGGPPGGPGGGPPKPPGASAPKPSMPSTAHESGSEVKVKND